MGDVILKVENISKQYQLGTFGTKTIGGDVHRWWTTKILGKEDPFLRVGQVNDRTSKDKAEFVWALRDINFEVKRGEVLGIIGKNGAGKSTLLKLLSRVTSPTTGTIKSAGRMASLLEVGTGFHPELTGRENIFLNGAILGMTKKEIQSKFDEIVDFSGCELYIDTPTKRYSSGMTVRLGFAVAAFLDPEILIVDEVLAVGDAEFQKKAIGKMQDISKGQGRTVLFVSHNMDAVKQLCTAALSLSNGIILSNQESLTVGEIVDSYLRNDNAEVIQFNLNILTEKVSRTALINLKLGSPFGIFDFEDEIKLILEINHIDDVTLTVEIGNNMGIRLAQKECLITHSGSYIFVISRCVFMPGDYFFRVNLSIPNIETIQTTSPLYFSIKNIPLEFLKYSNLNRSNYPFGYFYLNNEIQKP